MAAVETISRRQAAELFPPLGPVWAQVAATGVISDRQVIVRVVGSLENGYPQSLGVSTDLLIELAGALWLAGELERLDSWPARYMHKHFSGIVNLNTICRRIRVPAKSLSVVGQ